jgi:hypothetical protein
MWLDFMLAWLMALTAATLATARNMSTNLCETNPRRGNVFDTLLEYGAAMDMGPKRRKQQELALLRLDYGLL